MMMTMNKDKAYDMCLEEISKRKNPSYNDLLIALEMVWAKTQDETLQKIVSNAMVCQHNARRANG